MFTDDRATGSAVATATYDGGTKFTVGVKPCCQILTSDQCDCRAFAAEARGVFARPIMCRPASQWSAA